MDGLSIVTVSRPAGAPMRRRRDGGPPRADDPVGTLSGIGPHTIQALAHIGVATIGQLRKLGAVEAFARLRFAHGKGVTLNMLYGIDAALAGIDWRLIAPARKKALLAAFKKRARDQS